MAPPDQLLQPLGWLALAMAALGLILALGRRIGTALQLRLWGIPEALVAGLLGLLLAPSGPLPLLPQPVMQLWADLPLVLLTLVFGSLLLGRSEEHTSELQSRFGKSYAVFCLKKNTAVEVAPSPNCHKYVE